jgi:hypothetical protein
MRISPKRPRIRQPRNRPAGRPMLFACHVIRRHGANISLQLFLCKGLLA